MCKRIREDIAAVRQRDPAARSGFEILLMYAGVHQQYFKAGTGSGVALAHRRYVLPDPFAHKKTSHVEDEAFTL